MWLTYSFLTHWNNLLSKDNSDVLLHSLKIITLFYINEKSMKNSFFQPEIVWNASFMSLLWIWQCTLKSYQINVCSTCQMHSITAKLVQNLLNINCFASNDIISHPHFSFPVTPLGFAPFFLKLTEGKGFLGVCSLHLRHLTNIN